MTGVVRCGGDADAVLSYTVSRPWVRGHRRWSEINVHEAFCGAFDFEYHLGASRDSAGGLISRIATGVGHQSFSLLKAQATAVPSNVSNVGIAVLAMSLAI